VVTLERSRNGAIEERRCHLHRIARHDAVVERVEPARSRIVPGTVFDDDVLVDAVVPRFGKRRVGDLKHSDSARSRPVPLEGITAPVPGPALPRHRVARALDLRERREQSGEMTGVECSRKSGPYARQVAAGLLTSAWPTGKNISVGLRHVWTIQFAAAQTAARVATMRTATGALRNW